MKTKVYNLIILDESGSMSCVTKQTINGCNETINTIKSTQQKYAANQEHYISIYAFQSNGNVPSRYLVKNIPASAAEHISDSDYSPWGATPLYDAVGSCLSELKLMANKGTDVLASVTIITDGEENSSTQYTQHKVHGMISQLKELGWNFNFIGANIDVKATAQALAIDEDNAISFDQSEEGTQQMFSNLAKSHACYFDDVACNEAAPMSAEEKIEVRKKASKGFFRKK